MKWIAWFGLILFVLIMAYATWAISDMANVYNWWQGRLQAVDAIPIILLFSAIGLPFMLIGGLIAKPRYFWLAALIFGLIYLILIVIYKIVAISMVGSEGASVLNLLFVGIPAYISIAEGIYLERKGNTRET